MSNNTIQNKQTNLEKQVDIDNSICREAAHNIYENMMRWHPLREAAEQAAALLIVKMDNADFFTEKFALTEKQKEFIRNNIDSIMKEAADAVVVKKTDFEDKKSKETEDVVIRELIKIPEQTMAALGAAVNRGAVLAMTAVVAKSTSPKFDEIMMRKSSTTGDITIPTRGVFISTNCVEDIKQKINFSDNENFKPEVE